MKSFFSFVLMFLSNIASAEPMVFTTAYNHGSCHTCVWTAAVGEIQKDTPQKFREYLDANGGANFIVFDSPGGNLGAALELGRIIREQRLNTYVARTEYNQDGGYYSAVQGGVCESACAFAFLGGIERSDSYFKGGNKIGMHQFFSPQSSKISSADTQRIMGQLLQYILDLQIDPDLLTIASQVPPNSMYYFSYEELSELGITTNATFLPFDITLESGDFRILWEKKFGDKTKRQEVYLWCDGEAESWFIKIVEDIGHSAEYYLQGFQKGPGTSSYPAEMPLFWGSGWMHLGEESIASASAIGTLAEITITLPKSPISFAEEKLGFQLGGSKAMELAFRIEIDLPEEDVLNAMSRSCGMNNGAARLKSPSIRPRIESKVPPIKIDASQVGTAKKIPDVDPEPIVSRSLVASEKNELSLNLDRVGRKAVQQRLTLLGFDTKGADGALGPNSRSAIQAWQLANGFPSSGFLNTAQHTLLLSASQDLYDAWIKEEAKKPKRRRVKVCQRGLLGVLTNCRYEWR
ncbi:peptidoglycan-binding protein [Kordiimonas sp.]|uniref:peptidoglycan-binding protein n=1 Tax=Kordiimonas sp. TaxID=1970157 RepID=UPI003A9237BD